MTKDEVSAGVVRILFAHDLKDKTDISDFIDTGFEIQTLCRRLNGDIASEINQHTTFQWINILATEFNSSVKTVRNLRDLIEKHLR